MTQLPLDAAWQPPPAAFTLSPDDVHVWHIDLNRPAAHVAALAQLLAPDETARAAKFYFDKDRNHYIVGRGTLRTVLALYVGGEPAGLQFAYAKFGKPSLDHPNSDIQFNLSHAGGRALLAVTRRRAVGVDIEWVRDDFEGLQIAEHFFSPHEIGTLRAYPLAEQTAAFFTCWTRKEAYIKAHGEGLSLPLHSFDVAFGPNEPAALLATRPNAAEAAQWQMARLPIAPGFRAALVYHGPPVSISRWQWLT